MAHPRKRQAYLPPVSDDPSGRPRARWTVTSLLLPATVFLGACLLYARGLPSPPLSGSHPSTSAGRPIPLDPVFSMVSSHRPSSRPDRRVELASASVRADLDGSHVTFTSSDRTPHGSASKATSRTRCQQGVRSTRSRSSVLRSWPLRISGSSSTSSSCAHLRLTLAPLSAPATRRQMSVRSNHSID